MKYPKVWAGNLNRFESKYRHGHSFVLEDYGTGNGSLSDKGHAKRLSSSLSVPIVVSIDGDTSTLYTQAVVNLIFALPILSVVECDRIPLFFLPMKTATSATNVRERMRVGHPFVLKTSPFAFDKVTHD
jgi:hypothetical protein